MSIHRQFKDNLKNRKKSKRQKRRLARELAEKQAQEAADDSEDASLKRSRLDLSTPQPDPETASEDSESDDTGLQIDCPDDQQEEEHREEQEEREEPEEEGGRTDDEGGPWATGYRRRSLDDRCEEQESTSVTSEAAPSPVGGEMASTPATERPPLSTESTGHRPRPGAVPSGTSAGGGIEKSTQKELNKTTGAAGEVPTAASTETAAAEAAAAAAEGQGTPQKDAAGFLRPPPGLNVHYRLWQLGGLRLLLRAATHGMQVRRTRGGVAAPGRVHGQMSLSVVELVPAGGLLKEDVFEIGPEPTIVYEYILAIMIILTSIGNSPSREMKHFLELAYRRTSAGIYLNTVMYVHAT